MQHSLASDFVLHYLQRPFNGWIIFGSVGESTETDFYHAHSSR